MHVLTDNWPWKLFSVGVAFALWMLLVAETELATSLPVVVEYKNVPSDLEITTDHLDRIFMKVRGPASRLSPSEVAKTTLVVDLSAVHSPGEQTFTIRARDLGLPAGVTLLRVVPSQVKIGFERRGVRSVPVEIRFQGSPPMGYRVVSKEVSPDSVRVVGPELRLKQLTSVSTDPIDLSSTIGAGEFRVAVGIGDQHLRLEKPGTVSVRVSLEKIPAL